MGHHADLGRTDTTIIYIQFTLRCVWLQYVDGDDATFGFNGTRTGPGRPGGKGMGKIRASWNTFQLEALRFLRLG